MGDQLLSIYAQLIARFDSLPDQADTDPERDEISRKLSGLLRLIAWIDTHQAATLEEYRAEVRRVQESRP